jgi:hypothetical protein
MDISWISAFLASLHKLESAHELVGLEKFLQLTTITGRHEELKQAIIKARARLGVSVKQRVDDKTLAHIEKCRRQEEAAASSKRQPRPLAARGQALNTPFAPHSST